MKLNFKLSIMVVAILAVVVATVAIVLVNQVNEITIKNREGIDSLMKEVLRFKVE
jgi:hypothetical protein